MGISLFPVQRPTLIDRNLVAYALDMSCCVDNRVRVEILEHSRGFLGGLRREKKEREENEARWARNRELRAEIEEEERQRKAHWAELCRRRKEADDKVFTMLQEVKASLDATHAQLLASTEARRLARQKSEVLRQERRYAEAQHLLQRQAEEDARNAALQAEHERIARIAREEEERIARLAHEEQERIALLAREEEERLAAMARAEEQRLASMARAEEQRLADLARQEEERLAYMRAEQERLAWEEEQHRLSYFRAEQERLARKADRLRAAEEARQAQLRAFEQTEQARLRAEEEARQAQAARKAAHELYEEKWTILANLSNEVRIIAYWEIPWPVFHPVNSPSDITLDAMKQFLFYPDRPAIQGRALRTVVKTELLRWHQDKFSNTVVKRVQESEQDKTRETGAVVIRFLTDLFAETTD